MNAPRCKLCHERHYGLCPQPRRVSRAALQAIIQDSVKRQPAKPGRPLDSAKDDTLTATKPWLAAGISRRTWYRRRAETAVP